MHTKNSSQHGASEPAGRPEADGRGNLDTCIRGRPVGLQKAEVAPGGRERSRVRLKEADRQAVASPCDFRGACSVSGGIRPTLRAQYLALPQGDTLSAAACQAVAPTCDFREAGTGRSRTQAGPGRQGPELVRLWGCGGPIVPKARRGGHTSIGGAADTIPNLIYAPDPAAR